MSNKEVKKEEEDKNICSVSLIENDLMNLHLINAIDLLSMSEGKEWQSRAFPNCIFYLHFSKLSAAAILLLHSLAV